MNDPEPIVVSSQRRLVICLKKVGKWLLIAFFLLVLAAAVSPVALEIPFHFFLGWVSYLTGVLPKIQFNAELFVCSITSLILGCWGLHQLMPQLLAGRDWRFRWTLAWCALLLVLFATSIAATGVVHQAAWLFRTDKWIEMRGRSKSMRSRSNAMQTRTALREYAEGHEGRFPNSLREILRTDVLSDERVFFCHLEDGAMEPWCYAGKGLTDLDPGDLPIFWEPRHNREGKRIVTFIDGAIDFVSEGDFQAALARLDKRQSK